MWRRLRLLAGERREASKQFGLMMVRNRRISMKNARELMLEYTAFSFREPKKAAEMFAEDGAFELPYLATFGLPTEYKGRDAIAGFFQSVLDIYPGFQFENTKVLIDTSDQVFAEFEATDLHSAGRLGRGRWISRLAHRKEPGRVPDGQFRSAAPGDQGIRPHVFRARSERVWLERRWQ
jgi:hypothetical protein